MIDNHLRQLFDLHNQTAVITGGGGVLCSTMSQALAQAGAKVAVLDISLEAAQAVVDEIQHVGGEGVAIRCDVLDKASITDAAQAILAR